MTDTPTTPDERHKRLQQMPMAHTVALEIADTIEAEHPLEAHWLRNIARDCLTQHPHRLDRRRP